jgi:hypothetical protein
MFFKKNLSCIEYLFCESNAMDLEAVNPLQSDSSD